MTQEDTSTVDVVGFGGLNLSEASITAIKQRGFEEPTPIQSSVIPLVIEGTNDIIAQSQTGTGKTAAFGLPLLDILTPKAGHVQALILAPTRELAIQVAEELNSFRGSRPFHIVPIYGGQSYELQFRHLRQGVDIVVGTPGRVIDHLQRGSLDLGKLKWMVLDEADEMLDMGFIEDIEAVLGTCPNRERMLLFSATMPGRIRDLASVWMKNVKEIKTATNRLTADRTEQMYVEVLERDKFEALCRIVDMEPDFYGLAFCRTKVESDTVCTRLLERGYDSDVLHGDMNQQAREKVLDKFRKKHITILVATDVAARGIDVEGLTHVINYSLPADPERYVHRVGRTGRAGKEGTAITFVSPEEFRRLRFIQQGVHGEIRRERLPRIEEVVAIKRKRIMDNILELAGFAEETEEGEGSKAKSREEIPAAFHEMAEELIALATQHEQDARSVLAAVLFHQLKDELDHGRYADITELKQGGGRFDRNDRNDGFNRNDRGPRTFDRNDRNDRGDRGPRPDVSAGGDRVRLYVARGRADNFTKPRLVEFIRKTAKVRDKDIDNVELFEFYSFITVSMADAERIIHAFNQPGGAPGVKAGGKPVIRRADPDQKGGSGPRKPKGRGGFHHEKRHEGPAPQWNQGWSE